MSDSEIFDRTVRRIRRDRAAQIGASHLILRQVEADLLDRLEGIKRTFNSALIFNGAATILAEALRARGIAVTLADPSVYYAAQTGGVQCDEDRPHFPDASFDLILSIGLLDTVNDVPGALALMRRALKPDGLMLCAFAGAGSLESLRQTLRTIDPATQRTHPMIDVRAGGDLLARAGFKLAVADADTYPLHYETINALIADLRAHAATNILRDRRPLNRAQYQQLAATLPMEDTLTVITLTGWAASPF